MKARSITMMATLGVAVTASCAASSFSSPTDHATGSLVTGGEIKELPAVSRVRYPDSIGFLYQGDLANVLWLQNEPRAVQLDELVESMRRAWARGVAGEILDSSMQVLDPIPEGEPSLPQLSKAAVQSIRRMAQYALVTADYSGALSFALDAYNADAARLQAITATATRLDGALRASALPNPGTPLPAPPPPPSTAMLRPGVYFADAVRERSRARLAASVAQLEAAIAARSLVAYADVFPEVFLAQRDLELTRRAAEALAAHHVGGVLQGQPLDQVIATYVTHANEPRPLSVDQLSLVNRINLLANDASVPRSALVAALLLIDEDHRQGERDATLSPSLIWQHVHDAAWLVAELVRVKADGTTAAELDAQISAIVAGL
ncbi:MAG: hypothetical protein R3B48_19585 [Kofleriaceae bacterium]